MKPIKLLTEQINSIGEAAIAHVPNIIAASVLLILTWLTAKLARAVLQRILKRTLGHQSLAIALQKLTVIAVWLAGLSVTAIVLFPSIKPSNIIAGLGLGSVAVGFAFKDIFENFFAGMLILFRRPFVINDYIEVDDIEGQVESISIRDTIVRQTDGQPVVVPNAILFKNPVTVRTDLDLRRASVTCGIAYSEDVDDARSVILNAVESIESVNNEKPVQVLAKNFGDSSIDFEVRWWTGSKPIDVWKSRDEVITSIKAALDRADIEIPFPYRTLTFSEPLALDAPVPAVGAENPTDVAA